MMEVAAIAAFVGLAGAGLGFVYGRNGGAPANGVAPADGAASMLPLDDALLAYVSHELRTPLTAIIGYSEMLQEDAVFLDQQDFIPDLKRIQKAGTNLLYLVDDIVDLSKLQAGRVELEPDTFDVPRLVREVVKEVKPRLDKQLAVLDVQCAEGFGTIRADREKLQRALTNMIRHASVLTGKGELAFVVTRQGERVAFSLLVPDARLDGERFEAALRNWSSDEAKSVVKDPGILLGLVIARGLAAAMGGGLRVVTSPEQGAVFTLDVPAQI